jgi:hypothetical protein
MSTFWRAAKLSYLEYVNHSSNAVRAALKEPMRSKAAARGNVHLRERWYEGGVPGDSKFFFLLQIDCTIFFLKRYQVIAFKEFHHNVTVFFVLFSNTLF